MKLEEMKRRNMFGRMSLEEAFKLRGLIEQDDIQTILLTPYINMIAQTKFIVDVESEELCVKFFSQNGDSIFGEESLPAFLFDYLESADVIATTDKLTPQEVLFCATVFTPDYLAPSILGEWFVFHRTADDGLHEFIVGQKGQSHLSGDWKQETQTPLPYAEAHTASSMLFNLYNRDR